MKKFEKQALLIFRITLEYIFMFLIVLECNSAYRCISERVDIIYKLQQGAIIVGVMLVFVFILSDPTVLLDVMRAVKLLSMIYIFEVVFLLFNARSAIGLENYIYAFMIFFPIAVVLFQIYKTKKLHTVLFYRLSDIVLVLAVTSFILWFFSVIYPVLQPTNTISVDWGNRHEVKNYFYLFLPWNIQTEYIVFLNKEIIRNIGIFTETPMYNIFLCSALYTEFFLRKEVRYWRVILLMITILSTFGTIGIMLMLAAIFFHYVIFVCETKKSKRLVIVPLIALIIGLSILLINKQVNGGGSSSIRLQDYIVTVKAWREKPLFGCGYDNVDFIASFMPPERSNFGLSNSMGTVLAQGGLVLSTFCLLPFVLILKNSFTHKEPRMAIWAIGILALYATTIFHFRFYLMLVLAFGYSFFDMPKTLNGNGET